MTWNLLSIYHLYVHESQKRDLIYITAESRNTNLAQFIGGIMTLTKVPC